MRFEAADWLDGIDAGGRITLDGATAATALGLAVGLATWAAAGAEPVDLTTRLVMGSEFLGSALLASTGLGSTGLASTGLGSAATGSAARTAASTGRGRGNGLAAATTGAGAGNITTDPN